MSVTGLDHVNIRTLDIEASAKFYGDVLGLRYAAGPSVLGITPHWLCDEGGKAIIHLLKKEAAASDTGPIDHVAFQCRDRSAMIARLGEANIEYQEIVPGDGRVLLFIRDPHGVVLELGFREA